MLKTDGHNRPEALHQTRNGRSLFGHPDEDLTRLTVGVKTDRQITFMASNSKVMRERRALVRKAVPVGIRRPQRLRLRCLTCGERIVRRRAVGIHFYPPTGN